MIKKINWGTAIILFFVVFLSLAAIFITFAMRQTNDLVADDYYEQGAHFSKTIEIKKRSLPFKDSITLSQDAAFIHLKFPDTIVHSADSFRIQYYCGANRKNDLSVSYKSIKTNELLMPIVNVKKSFYTVNISWWVDSLQYMVDKEIIIK